MLPSRPCSTKALLIVGTIAAVLLPAGIALATVGVGVGTGKIKLDEPLKPGLAYSLPPVMVSNTGTQAGEYEMEVTFNEKQPQFKPDANWFSFSPHSFELKPHQAKRVQIKLQSSVWSARPGTYFAYLEAHPSTRGKLGKTRVQVAAATKLSFEIQPANFWQKLLYWLIAFWERFKLVIIPLAIVGGTVLFVRRLRKHVSIEFKRKSAPPGRKQKATAGSKPRRTSKRKPVRRKASKRRPTRRR